MLARRCKISSKGQIVIPQEIRAALGVEAGQEIEIRMENGQVTLSANVSPETAPSKRGRPTQSEKWHRSGLKAVRRRYSQLLESPSS